MSDLPGLIRTEARLVLRHLGQRLALLLYALALGAAALVGGHEVRSTRARVAAAITSHDAAIATQRARLVALPATVADRQAVRFSDPACPYGVGAYQLAHAVVRPPDPLGALATRDHLGAGAVTISIWSPFADVAGASTGDPGDAPAGGFDLVFVVVWLLPLAVIALACGMVAEERAAGRWRLLAVQAGSPRRLLVAKVAARLVLVTAATAAGAILALMVGGDPAAIAPASLAATAAWIAAAGAWAAFWLALAVAIDRPQRAVATQGLGLLIALGLLVVVVPTVLTSFGQVLAPPPDRRDLVLALRAATVARDRADLAGWYERWYAAHPQHRPDAARAGFSDYRITRAGSDRRMFFAHFHVLDERLAPTVAAQRAALKAHRATVERWARWTPATALQRSLEDLAGAAPAGQQRFLDQAEDFRAVWRAHFAPLVMGIRSLEPAAYERLPVFASAPAQGIGWHPGLAFVACAALLLPAALARWRER